MLKRFTVFFVSFCLVFSFVCSSFVSLAVAPVALVEAALVSYVASTGYKLWVDNGTGSDVLSLMSDLYSDWLLSLSGGTLTLEQIGNQNLVYSDNSGHIVITKTAADIFQDFSDWIQSQYSVVAGASSPTTVIQPSSAGLLLDGSPVYVYDWPSSSLSGFNPSDTIDTSTWSYGSIPSMTRYTGYYASLSDGSVLYNMKLNNKLNYGIAGVNSGAMNVNIESTSVCFICYSGLSGQPTAWVGYNPTSHIWVDFGTLPQEYWGIIGAGSSGLGLAVSLAQNVIDKATDLAQDYVLVFDVGASAGATATDIADAVAAGYDTATGVVPVTDTIIAADVIDTPVQPYPDVDSLGLPQLGLALTTRFPFSIPWDISAIYSAISAPSEPPVKTFDLIPASVLSRWGINANTSITIDLTEQKYSVLLAIIHWSCIIGFCFGLAVMTKRYVWTTGG